MKSAKQTNGSRDAGSTPRNGVQAEAVSKAGPAASHEYIPPHKFEVLYYIAKYGSPQQAARKMPYGVTVATLYRKLGNLERQLKLVLYDRRMRRLTRAGQAFYNLHKPVYEDASALVLKLRQEKRERIIVGASPAVLREYLPGIIALLRKKFPELDITCKQGSQQQLEEWLQEQLIDVAVMILDGKTPAGYECQRVARLPLALLVPAKSNFRSAAGLWQQKCIQEDLIALEEDNPVTRSFEEGLQRRQIEWRPSLRADSIEVAETYVEQGLGIALSVALPGRKSFSSALRALPLSNFPHLSVGIVWRCKPSTALLALIQELRRMAKRLVRIRL